MSLSVLDMVVVACAGLAAGVLNTAAAGGALVSFLAMVGVGVPPLTANVANLVATPAAFVAATATVRTPASDRPRWASLTAASAGTVLGVALLRLLPPATFLGLTPWLVLAGAALLAAHPTITASRHGLRHLPPRAQVGLLFASGVYAGLFGAGVGVIILLSLLLTTTLQFGQASSHKNLICLATSTIGATALLASGHVHYGLVGLLAVPTALGGLLGSYVLTRLPGTALRWIVVAVSATSGAIMLAST